MDNIWSKKNCMPESVTDRPTQSHEHVFLLAKSARYYYDALAIAEPSMEPHKAGRNSHANVDRDPAHNGRKQDAIAKRQYVGFNDRYAFENPSPTRNKRSVWEIATQPYPEAHFATFPEALVVPCIQAGTSEWGCCPECGAQWARVVEKGLTAHDGETASVYPKGTTAKRLALLRQAGRERGGG